ncbi:MAG: B12-binding domain-containing radical SAM protein [Thermodesulfobacteriota bacterium]
MRENERMMTVDSPHIICINPWIHDFAAYDFWAKPLGLLFLAAVLRAHGMRVSYVDCLDRFHPKADHPGYSADGRGPYRKTPIPAPEPLADVPARFSRYGIDPWWLAADLASAGRPDLVLVTSLMTYWYTGVAETIAAVKRLYPDTKVLLGGIYATLLPEHALVHTGADEVLPGPAEATIFRAIEKYTGFSCRPDFDPADMGAFPYPAFDLQSEIPYAPLLTARGCPNRCAYCASHVLQPRRMRRLPENAAAEIAYWNDRFGVRNFAFYDDALLADAEDHAIPLLERIAAMKKDLSFHTPNALHVRPMTSKIADLMVKAGFATIRLGLERADGKSRDIDDKVHHEEFVRAVRLLLEAGFDEKQIGAYLLVGLPGQDLSSVEASIDTVKACGIRPVLAYYTPIPRTRMWEAACRASRYDLAAEPLFTNNSLMPCMPEYDRPLINRLKQRASAA